MSEQAYINEIRQLQEENERLRRDYQELLMKTKAAIAKMNKIINNKKTRKL